MNLRNMIYVSLLLCGSSVIQAGILEKFGLSRTQPERKTMTTPVAKPAMEEQKPFEFKEGKRNPTLQEKVFEPRHNPHEKVFEPRHTSDVEGAKYF